MTWLKRILMALGGLVVACLALVGLRRRQTVIVQHEPAQEPLRRSKPRIEAVRLRAKTEIERSETEHGTLAEEQARADKALDRWRK